MTETKNNRIQRRKDQIGSRHTRVLKTFTPKFNTIFNFFLKSYRSKILDFGGSFLKFESNPNSPCARECFRLFENGFYSNGKNIPTSRHPNVIESLIISKKSFGLHVDMWSDGIVEGTFLKHEILDQFKDEGIEIPESLLTNFYDLIYKKTKKYVSLKV